MVTTPPEVTEEVEEAIEAEDVLWDRGQREDNAIEEEVQEEAGEEDQRREEEVEEVHSQPPEATISPPDLALEATQTLACISSSSHHYT